MVKWCSNPSLDTMSGRGYPMSLTDNDGNTDCNRWGPALHMEELEKLAFKNTTVSLDGLEDPSPSKWLYHPHVWRENWPAGLSFITHCKFPAPFGSPTCQYSSAIFCLHASTEAVSVLTFRIVGLKRPFHSWSPALYLRMFREKKEGCPSGQSSAGTWLATVLTSYRKCVTQTRIYFWEIADDGLLTAWGCIIIWSLRILLGVLITSGSFRKRSCATLVARLVGLLLTVRQFIVASFYVSFFILIPVLTPSW